MTIDNHLIELEAILPSILGTYQVAHPSFQDVLTAKQYAEEITVGSASVASIFDVFNSIDIVVHEPVLRSLAHLLHREKARECLHYYIDRIPPIIGVRDRLVADVCASLIHSGEISAEEFYQKYWSYKVDKELFGLECSSDLFAFVPKWRVVLLNLATRLGTQYVRDVVEVLTQSHYEFKNIFHDHICRENYGYFRNGFTMVYNPLLSDLLLADEMLQTSGVDAQGTGEVDVHIATGLLPSKYHELLMKPEKESRTIKKGNMVPRLSVDCDPDTKYQFLGHPSNFGEDDISYIQIFLEDPCIDVAFSAVTVLGEIGGKESIPVIRQLIQGLPDDERFKIINRKHSWSGNAAFSYMMNYFRTAYIALIRIHSRLKPLD